MLVKDVMNKNVKTIRPDDDIQMAAEEMNESRVGSLVVVKSGGIVAGILTERDIMIKVVATDKRPSEIKVEDIMTSKLITISPDITLEDAAEIMTKYKIKKLPVMQDNMLIGIVTASDLVAYENSLIEKVASLLTTSKQEDMGG